MWTTDQLGRAAWENEGSSWYVDARGGEFGIGVVSGSDGFEQSQQDFSLCPVDQDVLPNAGEQFVRGNEWHVNYPQANSSYALRLAFATIASSKDSWLLEVTISVQTDLLDLHPKVDLEVMCLDIDSFVPTNPHGDEEVIGSGSAPISLAKNAQSSTGVLLGPHDSPFTTNHSSDSLLRLRLFGDFLEKGVIRKARPWLAFNRQAEPTSEQELESYWRQLCDSPLPLTP